MQKQPAYLFKFLFSLIFVLLVACNHDKEKVEQKVVKVRAPQDVDASVKKEIESLLAKRINYTTLVLFEDTIRTLEFFKPNFENESPYFTNKGKLKPLADTFTYYF
ncbi:MAG: hypothetical protein IPJ32_02230 [Sphingobacteriaceae bacterium]|nr:hypothetical protein [Sphingobacteriaceae bacterium]